MSKSKKPTVPLEDFETYAARILKENGFRRTNGRTAIIRVLALAEKALSPIEVEAAVKAGGSVVDPVSVYRNLRELEENGLAYLLTSSPSDHRYARRTTPPDKKATMTVTDRVSGAVIELECPGFLLGQIATSARNKGLRVEKIRVLIDAVPVAHADFTEAHAKHEYIQAETLDIGGDEEADAA